MNANGSPHSKVLLTLTLAQVSIQSIVLLTLTSATVPSLWL